MSGHILAEVLRNAGMLLAVALLFDLVTTRFPVRSHSYRSVIAGLAVGLLGIGIMTTPFELSGLIFDARSVLLAVSGLFFGAGATVIAMAATAAYRLQIGGDGAITGVLVIVASGSMGVAWRYWRRGELERIRAPELYVLGLAVHFVMLALMFTLPSGSGSPVLAAIALPVLVVFPVATTALGCLMLNRLRRERLTAQLESSEARYRSLFENNHAIMLVSDPTDGRIMDANPAAERFYGWSRDELTRRSMSDIAVLSESDLRAGMQRARQGERTFFRFQHRLASGVVRRVEAMSGEVAMEGRSLLYTIIRDVTVESRAIEALRLRSAALDAAANAIMITDRDGTIEWVNTAFSRLYGYTHDEVVGRNPRDVARSGVHGEGFYRDMWRTLLAGETWTGRITNRRKDGSHFEEEMAITPLRDASGEIAHFIAVKQDLTDWRAMEERLALARKLESVGQLAGGVAHDFNNLLTVINGTLDLVLSDLPGDHASRGDLVEIRSAGQRASTLTRQLLAFGGRQVLQTETVDLNGLILDMNRMLRRVIGEDISVVTDLDDNAVFVVADRGQLEQIIMNLVINARDAMPTGGTLTLATANDPPQTRHEPLNGDSPRASHVRLSVRDTGVGIDPAIQSRIFDPFFTTKEAGKGTGLGLATVYGIVTQSGGDIHLESALGKGTAFAIRLPRAETSGESPKPAELRGTLKGPDQATRFSAGDCGTILLVEDDSAIRKLARRILSRSGYTVVDAGSGQEALELLREHGGEVALLFTDIVMPAMSGVELQKQATALRPRLKVLFASGYVEETLIRHGLNGNGHHFLEKPYTSTVLTNKVRSILDA